LKNTIKVSAQVVVIREEAKRFELAQSSLIELVKIKTWKVRRNANINIQR
jgi:hypothetical protein